MLINAHADKVMMTRISNSSTIDFKGAVLPEEQYEMLRLLATGLSDQAIGRRLGMSRRTVQRRVRSLMDHFGVETRFQLGMRAAQQISPAT